MDKARASGKRELSTREREVIVPTVAIVPEKFPGQIGHTHLRISWPKVKLGQVV